MGVQESIYGFPSNWWAAEALKIHEKDVVFRLSIERKSHDFPPKVLEDDDHPKKDDKFFPFSLTAPGYL